MRPSATTLASELAPAELHALVRLLEESGLRGPHLEIGTAAGGTLKELMLAYPNDWRPRFVVVDPMGYFPNQREVVERNLRSAGIDPAAVDFRIATSWTALQAAVARNERFSFIFIDGDHNADHVMQDLTWARLLEPGGYLCLHDYQSGFPGVVWATNRFLRKNPAYRKVTRVQTLMIINKQEEAAHPEVSMVDRAAAVVVRPLQRLRISLVKRLRAGAGR